MNVKKVANEFEITERTIYRDLKALEDAGVPIGYEPGGGYFLLEGYQLPPIHFTSEEAKAVVTAQAIIQQNNDNSLVSTFAKAVEKIVAVLKSGDKDEAIELKDRIAPSLSKKVFNSNSLMTIQECIINFQVLKLEYTDASGKMSEREIEPLAIYFTQSDWVVVAHCRMRNANREFRTDRIRSIKLIDSYFPPNQFSLTDYFKLQESLHSS
ncbi:MAG: YafY family protein [Maribacter sp.]